MSTLIDIASVIRSKNAGPLTLSFDLMFSTKANYALATRATSLTPASLSVVFNQPAKDILVTHYYAALAIKIAMPRAVVSGSPSDRDVYGAQQHLPLLSLPI